LNDNLNSFKTLTFHQEDGIMTVALNVPEKRNAMIDEMTREFPRAVRLLRRDESIRVVVLTGAGSVFCAGGSISMLEERLDREPEENRRFMGDFYRAYLSILDLDVPTIAALNGHAIGAGLALALGCDMRFAAEGAKFGVTFLNLGLHPGMGTTYLLPQTVGYANAADLFFTGRLATAREAKEMGLISRILSQEELMPASIAVAKEIATKPPSMVRMAKRALMRQKLANLESALDYEAIAQMGAYASPEMREAIAQFR
jgi:enoyl-CoA hydratase